MRTFIVSIPFFVKIVALVLVFVFAFWFLNFISGQKIVNLMLKAVSFIGEGFINWLVNAAFQLSFVREAARSVINSIARAFFDMLRAMKGVEVKVV